MNTQTIGVKSAPKYQILSPDGFTIEPVEAYPNKEEAIDAFVRWKEGYRKQGYYSSNEYGRIHPSDLQDYCQFKEI